MNPTQTVSPLLTAAKELDETKVSPGLLGFLVFAALGVAVWLLLRSMNRQINRVNFEEEPEPAQQAPSAGHAADSARATAANARSDGDPGTD